MQIPNWLRTLCLVCSTIFSVGTPSLIAQNAPSPYQWYGFSDVLWTTAGLLGSGYGVYLINQKEGISDAALVDLTDNAANINFLDRWVVGNDSEHANEISNIPFFTSFAAPFILLLDNNINDHTALTMGLYLQALATTATLYSITAGVVNRSRPYVYSEKQSIGRRTRNNGQRSFYSGHTAATATASFFAAKVYHDFYPNGKGKFLIWTGAVILPAAVGYYRLRAGQHFLTDVLIGYALGAAVGIVVPELHKFKNRNLALALDSSPSSLGSRVTGLTLKYSL